MTIAYSFKSTLEAINGSEGAGDDRCLGKVYPTGDGLAVGENARAVRRSLVRQVGRRGHEQRPCSAKEGLRSYSRGGRLHHGRFAVPGTPRRAESSAYH
ncbi:hypothetical protein Esi_0168_0048 [Ectocarpus siliculosus]|uniref:Uncharacterized protein n=1 Tax=Ectocarpus siliculosus TaxID=2880 RepID=D8LGJ3_ECTSI|nr:hypothetical protein Esi_0168_0048 [Ectocarpus siliculosus]|eukprot:CBN79050.1 hypothetical protein Esi_0168_0048 [Ectocarpus siliculosus]